MLTPLGSDRDTYLQPVLRDRGNKTATERCKTPPPSERSHSPMVTREATQHPNLKALGTTLFIIVGPAAVIGLGHQV